jgi:hypothetical protein
MRFPFEEQAEYLRTLQQGASASVQCTLLMSTRAHDFSVRGEAMECGIRG